MIITIRNLIRTVAKGAISSLRGRDATGYKKLLRSFHRMTTRDRKRTIFHVERSRKDHRTARAFLARALGSSLQVAAPVALYNDAVTVISDSGVSTELLVSRMFNQTNNQGYSPKSCASASFCTHYSAVEDLSDQRSSNFDLLLLRIGVLNKDKLKGFDYSNYSHLARAHNLAMLKGDPERYANRFGFDTLITGVRPGMNFRAVSNQISDEGRSLNSNIDYLTDNATVNDSLLIIGKLLYEFLGIWSVTFNQFATTHAIVCIGASWDQDQGIFLRFFDPYGRLVDAETYIRRSPSEYSVRLADILGQGFRSFTINRKHALKLVCVDSSDPDHLKEAKTNLDVNAVSPLQFLYDEFLRR